MQFKDFDTWEIIEHLQDVMYLLDKIPDQYQTKGERLTRKHIIAMITNRFVDMVRNGDCD